MKLIDKSLLIVGLIIGNISFAQIGQALDSATYTDTINKKSASVVIEKSNTNKTMVFSERFLQNSTIYNSGKITFDQYEYVDEPLNSHASETTRINYIDNSSGLGYNLQGEGMVVGVWETAESGTDPYADPNHPDLVNKYTIIDNDYFTSPVAYGHHASHVTATIMGSGNVNSLATGMAPKAKAYGYSSAGDYDEAKLAITDYQLLLSNHSYGTGFGVRCATSWEAPLRVSAWDAGAYDEDNYLWDDLMYKNPNYLMVVGAGNDGCGINQIALEGETRYDQMGRKATLKNNIVVANAAVINTNGLTGFFTGAIINGTSSKGPTDDYRIKPDITALGTNLYSASGGPKDEDGDPHNGIQDADPYYHRSSGTSMAAPVVTGACLLLQEHSQNLNNGSPMRGATLKGLVLHTADDAGVAGPDPVFGWGVINAKKAALVMSMSNNASNGSNQTAIIKEATIYNNESCTYFVQSIYNYPLEVSISWTDPMGPIVNPGAFDNPGIPNIETPVLVNDLDVRVTRMSSIGEAVYYPFYLNSVTTNTTGDNKVDPFEKVIVPPTAQFYYKIVVSHKGSLQSGKQDYSLIITGMDEALPNNTNMVVSGTIGSGQNYYLPNDASGFSVTSSHIAENNSNVAYLVTDYVKLTTGFHAKVGASFQAEVFDNANSCRSIENVGSIAFRSNSIDEDQDIVSEPNNVLDEEHLAPSNISIYPNPTNSKVTIEIPEVDESSTVSIVNFSGQTILTKRITEQKTVVDLSSFSTGLYLFNIVSNNTNEVFKIMKE